VERGDGGVVLLRRSKSQHHGSLSSESLLRRCLFGEKILSSWAAEQIMKRHITIEELFDGTEDIAKLIEEIEFKKKWDREHTYVIDIIKLLHGRKFGVRKIDLDDQLLEKRTADGERIPKKFAETTQSVLNNYTSQSLVFQKAGKGPEDDLFYSPKGKNTGVWAVHADRVRAWLRRKINQPL
jgi:hypothetical protein